MRERLQNSVFLKIKLDIFSQIDIMYLGDWLFNGWLFLNRESVYFYSVDKTFY